MITVPANFQTVLKKSEQVEFRYIVKLERSLIASPYTVSNFYLTTFKDSTTYEITDTGVEYPLLSLLEGIPGVAEKMDIVKQNASIGGFSLDIINAGLFSDEFDLYNIYNKDVKVYLWIEGLTDIDDCLLIYEGVSRDINYNSGMLSFSIENDQSTKHKDLPSQVIESTDLIDFTKVPASSLGEEKQIVYGDHIYRYAHTNGLNTTSNPANNLIKLIYLGQDATQHYFLASGHALDINEDSSNNVEGIFWYYESVLNRMVRLELTFQVHQNSSSGCIVKLLSSVLDSVDLFDYWWGDGTSSNDQSSVGEGWDNIGRANDLEYDEAAEETLTGANNINDKAEIDVDFDGYSNGETIGEVAIFCKTEYEDSGTGADFDFKVNAIDCQDDIPEMIRKHGVLAATEAGANASVTVLFEKVANGEGATATAKIYEVYKQIKYTVADRQSDALINGGIYMSTPGRRYGTWINSRPNHPDDDKNTDYLKESGNDGTFNVNNEFGEFSSAGADFITAGVVAGDMVIITDVGAARSWCEIVKVDNLNKLHCVGMGGYDVGVGAALDYEIWARRDIENPLGVIESIYRDELGTSDLNTASFDNVATERSAWKYSFILDRQTPSMDIIDKLSMECLSTAYPNLNNLFFMDTFYASNDTDLTVSKHDIGNIEIKKTALKDLYNELLFQYNKDVKGSNYQKTLNREDDRANIGSQAVYNAVYAKTKKSDSIVDATTAGLSADHWTKDDADSFWSVLRNLIEIDFSRLRGKNFWQGGTFKPLLALELTDIIEIKDFGLEFILNRAQYVTVPADASFQAALPVSMEIWVKFPSDSIGVAGTILSTSYGSTHYGLVVGKTAADKITLQYGDGTGGTAADRRTLIGDTAVVANKWYSVGLLAQTSGADGVDYGTEFIADSKIYINGVEETYTNSGTTENDIAYNSDMRIGDKNSNYFNGIITQIGLLDAALSAADFLKLSKNVKDLSLAASYDTDRTGDLQAYYRMDHESGTFLRDRAQSNDGTTVNSPDWIEKFTDRIFGQSWHGKQFKVNNVDRKSMKFGAFQL